MTTSTEATPTDTEGRCAACGSENLEIHWNVRGEMGEDGLIPTTKEFGTALGDIVRCNRCSHMQLDHVPSEQTLSEAYAVAESDDYVGEEVGQRASFRRMLGHIERHAPRRGRMLDVGCWVGFLLAEARDGGWAETIGIEPSDFASAYARDRLDLDVRTEDFFTADLRSGFDAIVLADVLEHMTTPNAALDRAVSLLADDGVLCLALPDTGSRVARLLGKRWWSVIPTHLHYFTRDSATTMIEGHGLEVLGIVTDPKAFTVEYYLDKGSGYLPRVSKALVAGARKIRLADKLWAPDFRDRMVLIARRRSGGTG